MTFPSTSRRCMYEFPGTPTLARARVHASMQISDRTSWYEPQHLYSAPAHQMSGSVDQCECVDPEQISIQFLSRYSTGSMDHSSGTLIPNFFQCSVKDNDTLEFKIFQPAVERRYMCEHNKSTSAARSMPIPTILSDDVYSQPTRGYMTMEFFCIRLTT